MHGQKGYDILVIDDDGISRNIFQKHLIKAGFNVASAPDGRQALDRFDDHFFPIVITDWMMPKIDGPMLCQLIREKRTEGYVYIIMITAKDTKTDVVSGLKSGADDYLTKPIHPGELIARVHSGIRILNLESSLKKAKEDIRWLTITDPLTACFNRGYLKDQLPKEMRHAIAASLPLSLIMADIDFFKHVNDTYGHQAGDEIIKVFSGCIQQQLRKKVDWMVRYGGEEFLIVLPKTTTQGALIMAERLRLRIERLSTQINGQIIKITASFGGTSALIPQEPSVDVIMEQMIQTADKNMYDSKKNGRNQVKVVDFF